MGLSSRACVATLGLAIAAAGCFPRPQVKLSTPYTGGVTYVPTSTPGMMFVVVHPNVLDPGRAQALANHEQPSGGVVGVNADYILLCDGRAVDGMRCQVATEATLARWSYTPHNERAATPVPGETGSVPGPAATTTGGAL